MADKKSPVYDVAVIGGGVVGCAVLRELSRYDLKLLLLEREADLAEGISKGNSGVIHAGFNVPPGSLKARTNVAGLRVIYGLASELGVPHRKTGKLVVALTDGDRRRLEELKTDGDRNGVPDLEVVDEAALRRLEPLARGRWALYSPHSGIISPYEFTVALAENARANGARVLLEAPVEAVAFLGGLFRLATKDLLDLIALRTAIAGAFLILIILFLPYGAIGLTMMLQRLRWRDLLAVLRNLVLPPTDGVSPTPPEPPPDIPTPALVGE